MKYLTNNEGTQMKRLTNEQRLSLHKIILNSKQPRKFVARINPGNVPNNILEVWCDHPEDNDVVMRYGLNDDGSVWEAFMQPAVDAALIEAVRV